MCVEDQVKKRFSLSTIFFSRTQRHNKKRKVQIGWAAASARIMYTDAHTRETIALDIASKENEPESSSDKAAKAEGSS